MRVSKLFTKSNKSVPADETAKNAQLLIKAGFIHKEMAGVYSFLPLGLIVAENIKSIIRDEMNSIGSQELIMTSLQSKELWASTNRWDDKEVDIWFKSKLKNGSEVGFGWSHEEQITAMMTDYIKSYRDLPANVYQFQTKLRNEIRAKSGIMRTREFVMKDLYSYSKNEKEHQAIYDSVTAAYLRIFDKVGFGESTYVTFASGGAFTQFSHEFQTITEAGEDTIYIDKVKRIAINEEVLTEEVIKQLGVKRDELEKVKAAEVGNIFSFGTAKSEQLNLYFNDEEGNKRPVVLGSYGIGVGRLMGVIVEHFADGKGLIWPEKVAPFKVYLAQLGESKAVAKKSSEVYEMLGKNNITVLWDDRDERPGIKFTDADLYGIPYRLVISDKTVVSNKIELKPRSGTEVEMLTAEEVIKALANN